MPVTHTGSPNRKPGQCRDCGAYLNAGEGLLVTTSYYDWDDPDEDVQGSITKVRYEVECVNRTECAQRVVEGSTDIDALKRVARDYENLGELATKAKQVLREMAEMARQQAWADDGTARENGWGAIGGPAH